MPSDSRKLNFGCGPRQPEGWHNVDIQDLGQTYVNDILEGLPFPDNHFDYVVANHSLQSVQHRRVVQALEEILRVTKVAGTVRILVPDIQKAFAKWLEKDASFFPNKDGSLDERFCGYLTWFSGNVSVFTPLYLREVLQRAGWARVHDAEYRKTASKYAGIIDLDSRRPESLIVEATKQCPVPSEES